MSVELEIGQVADVFREWKRRQEADPAAFGDWVDYDSATYGEDAAAYFLWLVGEMEVIK